MKNNYNDFDASFRKTKNNTASCTLLLRIF